MAKTFLMVLPEIEYGLLQSLEVELTIIQGK